MKELETKTGLEALKLLQEKGLNERETTNPWFMKVSAAADIETRTGADIIREFAKEFFTSKMEDASGKPITLHPDDEAQLLQRLANPDPGKKNPLGHRCFINFMRTTPDGKREVVNQMKIIRHLGSGGKAAVYLVHDGVNKKLVAFKVPCEDLKDDGATESLWNRGIAIANKVHPGYPRIEWTNNVTGAKSWGIEMPYIDGGTVAGLMDHKVFQKHEETVLENGMPALSNENRLLIFTLFFHYLAKKVHGRGIVHRDLKPENMGFHRTGEVEIFDFDLSKDKSIADHGTLEKADMMGTASYASPEQLMEFGSADERSDIFSMGVIMAQAFTGKHPFVPEKFKDKRGGIIVHQCGAAVLPGFVQELEASAGKEGAAVILQCIQRDPKARYASAVEAGRALFAAIQTKVKHGLQSFDGLMEKERPHLTILRELIKDHQADVVPGHHKESTVDLLKEEQKAGVVETIRNAQITTEKGMKSILIAGKGDTLQRVYVPEIKGYELSSESIFAPPEDPIGVGGDDEGRVDL